MIITHKIDWKDCLSHQLYDAIEQGWPDEGKEVHFFWGLGADNARKIKQCNDAGKEWWFIDTGYITDQITRYPIPKIDKPKTTYFRICKGGIHSKLKPATSDRYKDLNIPSQKNLYDPNGHILVTPSSETVTRFLNGKTQQQWATEAMDYAAPHGMFRNKPRPGNEWWGIPIEEQLKGAQGLLTNMSLSAIDAILLGIPVIVDKGHICESVASDSISNLKVPDISDWIASVAENQFTLEEIKKGVAYDYLRV